MLSISEYIEEYIKRTNYEEQYDSFTKICDPDHEHYHRQHIYVSCSTFTLELNFKHCLFIYSSVSVRKVPV